MTTFKTTVSSKNRKEFVKSWSSLYQTGLLQLKNDNREGMDVGAVRPVSAYLIALILGIALLNWGIQKMATGLSAIEVSLGSLVLFFIALNLSYAIRPKWFGYLAKSRILPQNPVEVVVDDNGLSFSEQDSNREPSIWKWNEISKVLNFGYSLILYKGEPKSYKKSKEQVLLLNKEDLSDKDIDSINSYLSTLDIQNKFKPYYSYSDIFYFLLLCLLIALPAFFLVPLS